MSLNTSTPNPSSTTSSGPVVAAGQQVQVYSPQNSPSFTSPAPTTYSPHLNSQRAPVTYTVPAGNSSLLARHQLRHQVHNSLFVLGNSSSQQRQLQQQQPDSDDDVDDDDDLLGDSSYTHPPPIIHSRPLTASQPNPNAPAARNLHQARYPALTLSDLQRAQFLSGTAPARSSPPSRPQFRSKAVCLLDCKYCDSSVCKRGMKAILLADMAVELFSTDVPPRGVSLVHEDYQTRKCQCRIRDVACLGCGNVIGYHVTQPCQSCMDACNNGHFWMFHVDHVNSSERMNEAGTKTLLWANLSRTERDEHDHGRTLYGVALNHVVR